MGPAFFTLALVGEYRKSREPDSAWLTTLDSLTLVPAEVSVAGAVFLATLLLGVAVTRWRSDESK